MNIKTTKNLCFLEIIESSDQAAKPRANQNFDRLRDADAIHKGKIDPVQLDTVYVLVNATASKKTEIF